MSILIRPICIEDAAEINAMRRMLGVMENTLGIPSERIKTSENFLANLSPNSHQFVAISTDDSGRESVVGTVALEVSANPRLRHSATLGILVHRDYQGQGIGTKLMEAALDIADNWLMLLRVELGVYPDNLKAIKLYEKMGFVLEGTKVKAAIRNGKYVDDCIMGRIRHADVSLS